jgi:hypothetical protein
VIVYADLEQGSPEWCEARRGIPTASNFDKILTPGGKRSTQAQAYMRHLLAEMLIGRPIHAVKTSWMQRGNDLEGEAICFYEFDKDVAVDRVGFITNDAGTWGCSPDALVGDRGMAEFKCPAPDTHVGYMLYEDVAKDYRVQLQGQLFVAERDWTDICSYHPELPEVIVRVERDEGYIVLLREALEEFAANLAAEAERLIERGFKLKFPSVSAGEREKHGRTISEQGDSRGSSRQGRGDEDHVGRHSEDHL